MAVYEYKAIAKSGKPAKGMIDADSPASARRKLRDLDLYPTDIAEVSGAKAATRVAVEGATAPGEAQKRDFSFSRVTVRDVALLTRQFSVLLAAGMPLVEALTALLDQVTKPRLRRAVYDIRDHVKGGGTLADAIARHPRIFSSLYSNMVRAGEASGALEQVLARLADIEEHQAKLRARVLSTLAYPCFMAVFAVGVIAFLMVVIVPNITKIFEKQKQELPDVTKVMIGVSHFVGHYWWLLILAVIGLVALWRLWVGSERGRRRWDAWQLKVPVYGQLHLKFICARFSRTLGTMLESGLTMMKALDVVKSVVGNTVIEASMADVKAGVRRGKDLAGPLKETGLFPPMLIHMVDLGQRSGDIDNMLIKVADTYDEDVRLAIDAMVALMEPVIIIIMGVFVGFLVLSILLPILNMSKGIGH